MTLTWLDNDKYDILTALKMYNAEVSMGIVTYNAEVSMGIVTYNAEVSMGIVTRSEFAVEHEDDKALGKSSICSAYWSRVWALSIDKR